MVGDLDALPAPTRPRVAAAQPAHERTTRKGASGLLRRFRRARMTAQAHPNLTDEPALVVFGRDATGKPHASSFSQSEADLATKAPELMGLRLLPVRTDTERALATKVPRGRVFATGRAFVPFIKAALFTELQAAALNSGVTPLKLLTGPAEPTPAVPAKPLTGNGPAPVKQPCGWAEVQVVSIVLAAAPPRRY